MPLAMTSFNRAIRAVGAARWQRLHRAVYVIASAGGLHFWWMRAGKNDFSEPAVYLAIVAVLLSWRLVRRMRGVLARTASSSLVPDPTSAPRR